jgi:NMD protein affecting ribosome stability and mRNA decay
MFNSVSKITKALDKMIDKLHAHATKQEAKTERLGVDIELSTAAHERKLADAIKAHEAHLQKLATKRLDAFSERDRALLVAEKVSALVR